jgi:hypothetical protein
MGQNLKADAYRKCLRALDVAALEHDTPTGRALVQSVRQTLRTLLAADDPSLLEGMMAGQPAPRARPRHPNKRNCGCAAKSGARVR